MGLFGFGNRNGTPNPNAPTTGQRVTGAVLTGLNPVLGIGYRLATGYRNRNSVGGTYYGPMNRSGYTGTERDAIRNAPADQRQALMDLYRGNNATAQPVNNGLSNAMQQYQQQLGQSGANHMQGALNAEMALQNPSVAPGAASTALQGAAGAGLQGGTHQQNQPSTQQQISQLPAAMQTWIRNNGLPQTANQIRMATNAMYLDNASNMAASNYGQDINATFQNPYHNMNRQS